MFTVTPDLRSDTVPLPPPELPAQAIGPHAMQRRPGARGALHVPGDDAPAPDLDALDPEGPFDFPRGDALAGIDGGGEELIEEVADPAGAALPQVDADEADAPEPAT